MRLLEGLRLRVKDLEFERREILVRGRKGCNGGNGGKGGKDRAIVLPENLRLALLDKAASRPAISE